MFNKFGAVFLLMFASQAIAEDLQVLYVGLPQVGPPIALSQAFAKNLKIPYTFVSVKDCASAMQAVKDSKNVVYLISSTNTVTSIRHGTDCVPSFKPEEIVYTADNYMNYCRKAGDTKDIYRRRFTLGAASVAPIDGLADDFNKLNGMTVVPVSMQTSIQVSTSIINGDIDWGFIIAGIAEPLVVSKQLDCPYTTDPTSPKYIAKYFNVRVPEFALSWVAIAKTDDVKIRAEVNRVARSNEFAEYLKVGRFDNIKTQDFTQKDIDKFNKRNAQIFTEYYKKEK